MNAVYTFTFWQLLAGTLGLIGVGVGLSYVALFLAGLAREARADRLGYDFPIPRPLGPPPIDAFEHDEVTRVDVAPPRFDSDPPEAA